MLSLDIWFYLSSQVKKPERDQENTTHNCRNVVNTFNIPLVHDLSPLIINKDQLKNSIAITDPAASERREIAPPSNLAKSEAITPAVNQATETLPKTSEALSSCLVFNFIARNIIAHRLVVSRKRNG